MAIDLTGKKYINYDIRASRTGSNIKIGIHDSGGTTTEHTANVQSANTWETQTWDISGVSDANKDAIDSIIITVVNADAANTFYIDNFATPVCPAVQALTLTLNAPTINIYSNPATFAGSLTLYAPSISTTAFPATQALTLTLLTPTPNIKHPISNLQFKYFELRLTRESIVRVPYLDDPQVTGGCPQCGTYLYNEGRPVRSEAVEYGRNWDQGAYSDKRYVRCKRCGFMCQTQRDMHAKRGSRLGWGMKYVETDKREDGDE